MNGVVDLECRRRQRQAVLHRAYDSRNLQRATLMTDTSESKAELLAAVEDYRRELVPLIVPMTLLRHHVRAHAVEYLIGQVYLEPHPRELMLRNHV